MTSKGREPGAARAASGRAEGLGWREQEQLALGAASRSARECADTLGHLCPVGRAVAGRQPLSSLPVLCQMSPTHLAAGKPAPALPGCLSVRSKAGRPGGMRPSRSALCGLLPSQLAELQSLLRGGKRPCLAEGAIPRPGASPVPSPAPGRAPSHTLLLPLVWRYACILGLIDVFYPKGREAFQPRLPPQKVTQPGPSGLEALTPRARNCVQLTSVESRGPHTKATSCYWGAGSYVYPCVCMKTAFF